MNAKTLAGIVTFILCALSLTVSPSLADDGEKIKILRESVVNAQTDHEKAAAYKSLFTTVGRKGLKAFVDDKDISLALQANWESQKKVVKRDPPIAGRIEWGFEQDSMKVFLTTFAKKTGMEPPKWWREAMLHGDAFPNQHHAFIDVNDKDIPPKPKIEIVKDFVTVSIGKDSFKVSKEAYDESLKDSFVGIGEPIALQGADQSIIAFPSLISVPFEIMAIDTKKSIQLWSEKVWAARRGGGSGVPTHTVQICRKDDSVIIYGCESHGIYAEGFDAKTGKVLFRFCSCYWFNFSEKWGIGE